jgi:hypothetical protein
VPCRCVVGVFLQAHPPVGPAHSRGKHPREWAGAALQHPSTAASQRSSLSSQWAVAFAVPKAHHARPPAFGSCKPRAFNQSFTEFSKLFVGLKGRGVIATAIQHSALKSLN